MVAIAKHLASAHKLSLLHREYFRATHDPLTGLINQVALDERIEHEISLGARYNKSFAVLMLEVNYLQGGSREFGKSFANKLIIDFAIRLKNCVRTTDTVARYEENVFAILLPDVMSVRNVVKVIQTINLDLLSPFSVDGKELVLTPTIGISLYSNDGESRQQLIEKANIAMCQARNDALKNYRYYSTELDSEVDFQISVEDKIRKAIDSHNYEIHYQPVHARQNNITKFVDSIVRWNEAALDNLSADSIERSIENMELGKLFADIRLNEICRQISVWEAGGSHTNIPVFFSVSRTQFSELDLGNRFKMIVKNQNISSSSIALVIDEKSILDDVNFAIQQIKALKKAGFRIVIDNFSSGLSYIGKLSSELVDLVRIDSQMIDELDNCMSWLGVVEGIVKIVQDLRIETVISGINNGYQYKTLQNMSGMYWQGDYSYLIGSNGERAHA